MQRKFLKVLFRAYRCTSTEKLLTVLNIVHITDEVEIQINSRTVNSNDRTNFKNTKRSKILSNNAHINLARDIIDNFKHKFTLWCLTGTGPFKDFLYKIEKVNDKNCRYCGGADETPTHLAYECNRFELNNCTSLE